MEVYKKIQKKNHITYYFAQNKLNSRNAVVFADLSKHERCRELVHSFHEYPVAWVDTKTKKIEWDIVLEDFIDKKTIKNYIVMCV